MGGREIEIEMPSRHNSDEHKHALEIIKELCTQIKMMNNERN